MSCNRQNSPPKKGERGKWRSLAAFGACCFNQKTQQLMHDVAKPQRFKTSMKPTTKAVWKVIATLVGIFLIIAGIKVLQMWTMISAGKKMVPPPTTVTSVDVKQSDWQPVLSAVGSISPVQGAMITPNPAGTGTEIISNREPG